MTTQVINPPGLSITTPSSQNDHLWKVIEKQRSIIQDLQLNLAKVTEERDVLLKQVKQSSSSSVPALRQVLPLTTDLIGRAPSPLSASRNSDTTTTMLSLTDQTNLSSSTTTLNGTTRRAATSPFDLMFSSSDSKPLSSNTDITLSPTQTNDLRNYYIDEFSANDHETTPIKSASPQPLRANSNSSIDHIAHTPLPPPPQSTQRHDRYPQRQQSAPTSHFTDSASAGNHLSPTQQHHPVDTTPQHSASLDMIRYEDSYYDPSLENEEFNPVLSPSKSPEMMTYPAGLPATPSSPVPLLANIMVNILSSNMTTNEKGKDIFSFTISVRKIDSSLPEGMEQLWCAEKLFSDFVNLDYLVKSKHQDLASRLYRLPDRSLFLSKAPSKVDERKQAMERYIQQVLTLPLSDMSDVCEFLSTNVIEQRTEPPKRKFGYLTKRGKNFGGWKMRFFVLDGPTVNYYENKGGPYMGSISLARAQIGRQVAQPTSGDSFRHALMILEPKKSAPQGVQRHVLCADSDLERDQWVDAMSQFINYDDFGQPPPPPTTTDYRQQLNKFLQRSTGNSNGTDSTQQQDQSMDDDKKNKSRNFWGKKMFNSNNNNSNNNNNNDLSNLTQALQGGLTPEQATALMNSAELSGYMDGANVNGAKQVECGPNQVFGIPLDEAVQVCRISHDYELPALVYRCIEYLEAKNAAQEEGIYRLSGSAAKIKKLKEKFNQEGDVQLLELEEYNHEVHAIAGLLKMWLRELPGSVVTLDLLNDFLHIADMEDRGERTTELGRLVSLLPLSNYTLLRTLSAHLIHIVQNAGVNKMTLRNLGIVFSATLGIPAVIFNLFLTEFEYVFWTKQDHNQPILPPISTPTADTDTLPSFQLKQSNEPTLSTTKNTDTSYESSSSGTPSALSYPGSSSPSSTTPPTAFPIASRNRSNRNSIQYTDYAPQSIVSLENRSEDFGAIIDEEDEDNTLGFDYDPYMEQQNLQSHHPQIIRGTSPTYEYTATVIEPQIRR
ncbi:unnamed protein product [Absidia cylindrospora]